MSTQSNVVPAAAESPQSVALAWPAPHHMRVIDNRTADEAERALVTLQGGEKLLGIVLAIDFEQGRLDFQPERGGKRVLAFRDFRSLFLSRSIELESVPLAVPPGAVATRSKRVKRACTVRLKDGAVLQADVAAVLPRQAGLFLYVVNYADAVLRWFVPAQAVAHYRVGEHVSALPQELVQLQPAQAANVGEFNGRDRSETREEVEEALARRKLTRKHLGDVLVQEGVITPQQRDDALERQKKDESRQLHELLVEMGAVSREVIRQVMVSQLGVPAVNLTRFPFDANALKAIKPELARKHLAMPLFRSEKRMTVALENPLSWEALHELEFFTGLKVDPCLATRQELQAAIEQFYGEPRSNEMVGQLLQRLGEEGALLPETTREDPVTESDNTLVRLVNKMIMDAFEQGASDIHIESRADDKPSRVRFRIDGVLTPYIEVPPNFRAAFVSRLKIMAELDISERRRPQDGRILFENWGPRHIELRVVTIPTAGGLEDVVMRILAAPRALSLEQVGMPPRDLDYLKQMAARSYGLLFVCGPTGSGKTTTLHSLLAHINTPDRKIWTVEDPVEITQDGLCQVQVNPKLGLTFPEVLKSFLRADPDVIMVGETRDAETARTVTAASLTGHLVFSTMHTNSAVESVLRLLDLEVDPFNFSDALLGVVGQRLVRKLCHCKRPHLASAEEVEALAHEYCRETHQAPDEIAARWRSRYGNPQGQITLYAPGGCPECDQSGYKGRLGVYEVLANTPAVKKAIQQKAPSDEILRLAVADGMTTLEQDALEKTMQGHLDLKQVLASCR
ncbi:GspE/PulE family protein [Ramlibacter sp. AN1133]|uniref:GspE/PulE family protein n=1 Tax=Ramlibacter sp. AN1133 TaxID=3133429 RepID=UPI0030C27BAE